MVTGQLIGEGFRIEKILFESFPNHHVTALLYLPHGSGVGPWPGILFACGHILLTAKPTRPISKLVLC